MKKYSLIISLIIIVSLIIAFKWVWPNNTVKPTKSNSSTPEFVGTWARQLEYDAEFISFQKDGHFAYYGSEGNGINDYDLCDSYDYNNESKVITIHCNKGIGPNTPTKIEVINYTSDTLTLKFNNEEKTFISKKSFDEKLKEH